MDAGSSATAFRASLRAVPAAALAAAKSSGQNDGKGCLCSVTSLCYSCTTMYYS